MSVYLENKADRAELLSICCGSPGKTPKNYYYDPELRLYYPEHTHRVNGNKEERKNSKRNFKKNNPDVIVCRTSLKSEERIGGPWFYTELGFIRKSEAQASYM